MSSCYICIDGGTTNTRLSLTVNHEIKDTLKYNIGAGKSIESTAALRAAVKQGIEQLLERNGLQSADITRILASGMITSEFGLCCLEHIKAPAGLAELHNAVYETALPEISDIPFAFIRGVKSCSDCFSDTDMMRGEETELMGLDSSISDSIYILPGSHSKIIETDSLGRIVSFSTMLTGEMLAALSQGTVLKDAVSLESSELNKEYLLKGFEYCRQGGLNKALFKVRILKNMLAKNADECYSFFLGAVLCGEILEILSFRSKRLVIAGKRQLREAMLEILKRYSSCELVCVSDSAAEAAAVNGMIKIYEADA